MDLRLLLFSLNHLNNFRVSLLNFWYISLSSKTTTSSRNVSKCLQTITGYCDVAAQDNRDLPSALFNLSNWASLNKEMFLHIVLTLWYWIPSLQDQTPTMKMQPLQYMKLSKRHQVTLRDSTSPTHKINLNHVHSWKWSSVNPLSPDLYNVSKFIYITPTSSSLGTNMGMLSLSCLLVSASSTTVIS